MEHLFNFHAVLTVCDVSGEEQTNICGGLFSIAASHVLSFKCLLLTIFLLDFCIACLRFLLQLLCHIISVLPVAKHCYTWSMSMSPGNMIRQMHGSVDACAKSFGSENMTTLFDFAHTV